MSFDPLQNELVLGKVFEYLPEKARKNFRLVNKLWRNVTLDRWRKSMTFRIVHQQTKKKSGMRKFFKLFNGLKASANEVEPLFQFNEKPFSRFYLDDQNITIPPYQVIGQGNDKTVTRELNPQISYFFELCGPNIESLEISLTAKFWNNGFLQGMKWIFKHCPKLREISLVPSYSHMEGLFDQEGNDFSLKDTAENVKSLTLKSYMCNFPNSVDEDTLRDVFNLIPNLETLSLTRETVNSTFSALRHPLRRGGYIQLQKLNLVIDKDNFEMLSEYISAAKPHLSELRLKLYEQKYVRNPPGSLTFHRFMADVGKTLTKLTLLFHERNNGFMWIDYLTGHHFPHVTHLCIDFLCGKCGSTFKEFGIPIRFDFRCLTGFPKLQTFSSVVHGYNKSREYGRITERLLYFNAGLDWNGRKHDMEPVPLKDLKEFTFHYPELFYPDCLRHLAQWMPSVERLSIIADEEIFATVMDIWSLDKLTLLPRSSASGTVIKREEVVRPITIEKIFGVGNVVVSSDFLV